MTLGQKCLEETGAVQGDCAFPARDGGGSGHGEKQVPVRVFSSWARQGLTGCGNKVPSLWLIRWWSHGTAWWAGGEGLQAF